MRSKDDTAFTRSSDRYKHSNEEDDTSSMGAKIVRRACKACYSNGNIHSINDQSKEEALLLRSPEFIDFHGPSLFSESSNQGRPISANDTTGQKTGRKLILEVCLKKMTLK